MNIFKILALVFLGVAVVGGGAYLVMNNSGSRDGGDTEGSAEGGTEEMFNGGEYSLRGLMGVGQNVACTFSSNDADTGARMSGTVYVSGERVRGDYSIEQESVSMESHMIVKEGKVYSWTLSPMGILAQVMDIPKEENVATAQNDTNASIDERVQYDCNVWNIDESKFELPSGVDFKDLNATLDAGADASGNTNTNAQCAACEYIPDAAAKAECRAALSCE